MIFFKGKLRLQKIHLLLAIGLLLFILFNYRWLYLPFVSFYWGDEYGFYRVMRKMYLALVNTDIRSLFQYNYYNYGFTYFFLHQVLCFPFLASENTEMALFIPRMVSATFSLLTLLYLYKLSRLWLSENISLLIVVLVMSIPAFWMSGMVFHPDWMMGFLLLICIYNLALDKFEFGRNYRLAIIFMGFAIGIKLHAIIFLPVLFAYIFYDQLVLFNFDQIKVPLKRVLFCMLILTGIFLLNYPYLLHPKGFAAFINYFNINMSSNANNGFTFIPVDFFDKAAMLDRVYLNYIFLGLMMLMNFYIIVKSYVSKDKNIFFISSFSAVAVLLYLLIQVNKTWTHYYLVIIIPGIIALIPVLRKLKEFRAITVLIVLCSVQFIYYAGKYPEFISQDKSLEGKPINYQELTANYEFVNKQLSGFIKPDEKILITPFIAIDNHKLGIPFENIRFLNGWLSEKWISGQAFRQAYPDAPSSEFIAFDYLVLRKAHTIKVADQYPAKDEQVHAEVIENQLRSAASAYAFVAENEWLTIFRRKNPSTVADKEKQSESVTKPDLNYSTAE